MIEAWRSAFADRALLGDPDFSPNMTDLVSRLTAKSRTRAIAADIGESARPSEAVSAGAATDASRRRGRDTTHLNVVDESGNAVAMTTTVNYGWGAGIVAARTGVVWNDEMDDFAISLGTPNSYGIVGSKANAVGPGHRPLSSMSPTMVFAGPNEKSPLVMVVGSPGGSRIPTTVAQAILNVITHGAKTQQALTLGRIHHQHLPNVVFAEDFALDAATVGELRSRGHEVRLGGHWGNAMIITIDPDSGLRRGVADPRGNGTAKGQ